MQFRSPRVIAARWLCTAALALPLGTAAFDFSDSHFHLTNYVQQGLTLEQYVKMMGDRVERAAVFGIPLQQKWDAFESGQRAPDYYLLSDAELYYYSFVDAIIAHQYLRLPEATRRRVDPMITGFNPTDMYAPDHIRRVLLMYPGVFTGIGEFSVHKEFVSAKVSGHTATLLNPALDRIFDLCEEAGLLAILHNDINSLRATQGRPAHFDDLKTLLRRHPHATIVWAHTGLGRFVKPGTDHVDLLREILRDPGLRQVYFDISWDEVGKWIVETDASVSAWAALINEYPDRFLFGSDAVAPATESAYLKPFDIYAPLWSRLSPQTSEQVRLGNYRRLFDEARVRVRAWEKKQ